MLVISYYQFQSASTKIGCTKLSTRTVHLQGFIFMEQFNFAESEQNIEELKPLYSPLNLYIYLVL